MKLGRIHDLLQKEQNKKHSTVEIENVENMRKLRGGRER
jgi:hypothetical protein